ncbi:hypothetical protein ACKAV7_008487 [Fusarium commune]
MFTDRQSGTPSRSSILPYLSDEVQHDKETDSKLEPFPSTQAGVITLFDTDRREMKKNMGPLTMIAVCFNICNGWAGISASLQIALLQGGPATLLYGLFVSSSLYMGIALTMAELASVYPTAGGQYHFASILAPKRINRRLSYACALLTMLSWVSIGSAILMIPSAQILAFVQYCHPNFVQKPWHYFLIYEAVGLIPLAYNVLALKKLPRTHDVGCEWNPVPSPGYLKFTCRLG